MRSRLRPRFHSTTSTPIEPPTEGSHHWHYTYDGLGRVIDACAEWDTTTSTCTGAIFNYSYDGAGNLIRMDKWSGTAVQTMQYVYNGANQIKCIDANANGTCDGGEFLYQYDAY